MRAQYQFIPVQIQYYALIEEFIRKTTLVKSEVSWCLIVREQIKKSPSDLIAFSLL